LKDIEIKIRTDLSIGEIDNYMGVGVWCKMSISAIFQSSFRRSVYLVEKTEVLRYRDAIIVI
jgi:hypothetical protein